MTSSQTFPTLTKRIVEEHHLIHFYLGQLEKSVDALGSEVEVETLRRLAAQIDGVRERLEEHFASEDAGGMFRALAELLPEARADVDRLARDHESVLESLEMSRVRAQYGEPAETAILQEHLRSFLSLLRDHERREEALCARALEREARSS